MIELIDARSLILKTVQKTPVILKRLKETLNYVLTEDIKSDINYPPFTRSKMDGFAVCSKELIQVSPGNPLILEILETVQAGVNPNFPLKSDQTAKIMTGAPLPEGADAVVPFEEVSWQGSKAAFTQKITTGQHLSFEGEEIKKGQLVLTKDKIIGPGELVILALSGKEKVKVYSRPRTGILVTGEEITDVGKKLEKAKIRDTNSCMLAGQVKLSGGYPVSLGIAGDKKDEIAGIISSSLPELDLMITTGGAAAGEYDLTEEVFQSVGAEILFRRVAMKPGNYLVAAQKEGKFLFGLSGSPSGAFVS
ncbi:MAG: molybdopterin molybdenumtransferase MoeA, partial [Firmicutes bacterium HGW-Firmicutes-13]